MDDKEIIDLFFARSEEAIKKLSEKYGGLCHKLAYGILSNSQDAEECVNDAYLSLWNQIPPKKPDPLGAYLCKIVRNLSLKLYCRNTAVKRNSAYDAAMEELMDYLPASGTVESEIEAKELARTLESFLDTLTAENRVIFMRRYAYLDTYTDIAEATGLPVKTVSVRLTRIRKTLRRYLTERGIL